MYRLTEAHSHITFTNEAITYIIQHYCSQRPIRWTRGGLNVEGSEERYSYPAAAIILTSAGV